MTRALNGRQSPSLVGRVTFGDEAEWAVAQGPINHCNHDPWGNISGALNPRRFLLPFPLAPFLPPPKSQPGKTLTPPPPARPAASIKVPPLRRIKRSVELCGGFPSFSFGLGRLTHSLLLPFFCAGISGEEMLVLFETPAGFALFKVLDEGKLSKVEDLWKDFAAPDQARRVVELKAFNKFENTSDALSAATLLIDSKPSKGLRKFLQKHCDGETLAVADSKLGNAIKEKLKIDCVHNSAVMELMRGLRNQLTELMTGLGAQDLAPMSLGLSHSLSRYKLKFSPEKVDTMIIQAIGLLDDLDKELNTYAMRVREWYGWHFPELSKIVADNIQYANVVKLMGNRANAANLDFSAVLSDDAVEAELKEAAVISMGTEALFRALKTKHSTPKYGLIYHASLIGQAAPKNKGKISRSLAAKTALAIRYDALADGEDNSIGLESRIKLETRLKVLEGKELKTSAGSTKGKPKIEMYEKDRKKGAGTLITPAKTYNPASDLVLPEATPKKSEVASKKRKHEEVEAAPPAKPADEATEEDREQEKPKKKKSSKDVEESPAVDADSGEKKKKKKNKEAEEVPADGEKKKKKSKEQDATMEADESR
ncbi:hypothetical protein PR202_ga28882 [Eleusine coracana subsp. coracana]|uniref:Nop domain-containing protein n=1 Tax=Eleusine coracana subsp. coracana TaxID=191504 RepID=A0AAV5DJX8_ELECO|nr:hypothetical protein PR202_ga28882 [Eleusine coracana subsp. coracana]